MKNFLTKLLKFISIFLLRYGLGFIIIWFGLLKFKNSEAEYMHRLITGGYLSWVLKYITVYALSQIIAYIQIIAGIMLMLKPVSKRISFWGGVIVSFMFLLSISLLFTSSIVWAVGYGFPELSKVGQTVLKDFVLLGAAVWCVEDSM